MENGFFAMAFRMKYIRRWGLMYSVHPENLSTHSLEVALCAHALAVIGNTRLGRAYDADRIATKALFHDLPEIFTGDIPTPVKYYSEDTRVSRGTASLLRNAVRLYPRGEEAHQGGG